MIAQGASSFIKAILLVLLTSARPSFQDSNYSPSSFSDWDDLRNCVQICVAGSYGDLNPLGCSKDSCYCRPDIIPQAVSLISSCASSGCSNTNDVVTATSFFEGYCSSATNTAVISLISNNPPASVPGSVVTGTTIETITTTLSNGQPTIVGSIIYQYGNGDNAGNGNQNGGDGNSPPASPASTSSAIASSTTTPTAKSSADRQMSGVLGCGFIALVIMVMVVAA